MKKVTFEFETDEAAKGFIQYMCDQGEQDYWTGIEESGDPYAESFDYGYSEWDGKTTPKPREVNGEYIVKCKETR